MDLMHCVVVCEVAARTFTEGDELAVASMLGVSAYDVRLHLAGVLPRLVATCDTAEAASHIAALLGERGLDAIAFRAESVTSLREMVAMRRFGLGASGGLCANDQKPPERSFSDLLAIVHASLDVHVERTTHEVVYHPSVRNPSREHIQRTTSEHAHEQVLVLFWRDGTPWLMRRSEARFIALGARVRPTVHENFALAITWLRERAPHAIYDDRFVHAPLVPNRTLAVRDADVPGALPADRSVELALHALGAWLSRPAGGPYRGESRGP